MKEQIPSVHNDIEKMFFRAVCVLLFLVLFHFVSIHRNLNWPIEFLYLPILLDIHFRMQERSIPKSVLLLWLVFFYLLTFFFLYAYYFSSDHAEMVRNLYQITTLVSIILAYAGLSFYILSRKKYWKPYQDWNKSRLINFLCMMILIISIHLSVILISWFFASADEPYIVLSNNTIYILMFISVIYSIRI